MLPIYGDGCIVPNIRTTTYLVRFAPKCEHTKMAGAIVAVNAESADDAMSYAARWIQLAQLTPVEVIPAADAARFPTTAIGA